RKFVPRANAVVRKARSAFRDDETASPFRTMSERARGRPEGVRRAFRWRFLPERARPARARCKKVHGTVVIRTRVRRTPCAEDTKLPHGPAYRWMLARGLSPSLPG